MYIYLFCNPYNHFFSSQNKNMIYTFSNPEILKVRNVKVPHRVKQEDSNRKNMKNEEQLQRIQLTPREYSQKKTSANKQIVFHKINQIDSGSYETLQQKVERQVKKVKGHYETEINNLVNAYKRNVQDLQIKFSVAEKQKNHWRQTALKLKSDLENWNNSKINSAKNQNLTKQSQLIVHEQQNYAKIQKNNEQQVNKLKITNSQILAQVLKLRQENSKLSYKISKLESQPLIKNESTIKISHNQRHRPQSPMRRSNQSPSRVHSSQKQIRKIRPRDNFVDNSFSHIHSQNQKQLDRLRKICRKLDQTISDRNEEIMIVKAKQLAEKYSRIVYY